MSLAKLSALLIALVATGAQAQATNVLKTPPPPRPPVVPGQIQMPPSQSFPVSVGGRSINEIDLRRGRNGWRLEIRGHDSTCTVLGSLAELSPLQDKLVAHIDKLFTVNCVGPGQRGAVEVDLRNASHGISILMKAR